MHWQQFIIIWVILGISGLMLQLSALSFEHFEKIEKYA
jgi:hypothetical protein